MRVGVPGLWREKPEAGRSGLKTRKVLVEKEGLWGWNISGSSWLELEEGQQGTRHFPSDIQSHSQKALVPAKFKS